MSTRAMVLGFSLGILTLGTTACGLDTVASNDPRVIEASEQADAYLEAHAGPPLVTLQWTIVAPDADGKIADPVIPGRRMSYTWYLPEGLGWSTPEALHRAMVCASYAAAKEHSSICP